MPLVSKAQTRWAYASKDKPGSEGKAARDYIAAGPASSHLPERVKPKEGLSSKVSRQRRSK